MTDGEPGVLAVQNHPGAVHMPRSGTQHPPGRWSYGLAFPFPPQSFVKTVQSMESSVIRPYSPSFYVSSTSGAPPPTVRLEFETMTRLTLLYRSITAHMPPLCRSPTIPLPRLCRSPTAPLPRPYRSTSAPSPPPDYTPSAPRHLSRVPTLQSVYAP